MTDRCRTWRELKLSVTGLSLGLVVALIAANCGSDVESAATEAQQSTLTSLEN